MEFSIAAVEIEVELDPGSDGDSYSDGGDVGLPSCTGRVLFFVAADPEVGRGVFRY